MYKTISKITSSVFVLTAIVVAFLGMEVNYTQALTALNLRSKVQSVRYRVDFNDFKNGISIDKGNGPDANKFVKIFSLAPADQVISWVSNVTTPFLATDSTQSLFISSIRGYNLGTTDETVTSLGDIGMPADLSYAHIENRLGNALTYSFYDENNSVDIGVILSGDLYSNLANLTQGVIDFYVVKIE